MSQKMIRNRYRILKELGRGGMGSVFLAEDRLTNRTVALKRVLIPTENLQFSIANSDYDHATALAIEFRTLASLRHPHVVRVLDYGFDEDGVPFFTMEYLPDSTALTDVAQPAAFRQQITYLVQMLYALAYLHRRGIIHRDLKPANVLVNADSTVKVLDFGLALDTVTTATQTDDDDESFAGTIAYVAPEVLQGQPASIASDLYAVGVMAYEIFTSEHPFDLSSMTTLVMQILYEAAPPVDIDNMILADLIEDLLAKDPSQRPQPARTVMRTLYDAIDAEMPPESSDIRDSYLQASRFVGREQELKQLTDALQHLPAKTTIKSFWLVGGESGVGKSRLLEEVRIRALVQGVHVLRGQAVEAGRVPYQMWRDVLRPLLLMVTVSDLEAGIMKAIVPDIDRLLQRPVPDVAPLSGEANHERLALTVVDIFMRYEQPVLLLLEDLQWAEESLRLLQSLLKRADEIATALMVIGTYRTDDAPDMPEQLSSMSLLNLERFDRSMITRLSQSMLGEDGHTPGMIDLLERETEGNVFFVVEVMRVLAEQAGRLDNIATSELPEDVVAGGIQAILQRRISRMPEQFQGLLSRAAVAGRELDQQLLTQLSTGDDVEAFITAGANTAIFDVIDGVWRFAHDKLRQAVINEIPADGLTSLHHNVAQALEATYPDDKRYAEALARHWDAANMPEKALPYIIIASEEITNIVADYERAEAMIRRGLTLAEELPDKDRFWSQLYLLLGNVEKRRAELDIATTHFEKSLELAGDDATLQVPTLCNLAEIAYRTGRLDDMQQLAEHTLRLARASGEIHGEAVSLRCLGKLAVDNGDVETGFNYYEQSIALLQPTEYRIQSAAIYNDMGIACAKQGDNKRAAIYFEQALVIHRKGGNRAGIANLLTNLGMLANLNQDYDAAHKYFSESAETSRAIGYQLGMAITLGHLGMIANAQENYTHAVDYFHQSMTICRESHMMPEVAIHLANQAFAYISLGQYDAARANLTESLNLSQELSSVPLQLTALMLVAHLYYDTNNLTAARQLVQFIRHQEKTTAEYRALYFDPLIEKLSIAQHTIADDSKSLPDIVTEVQAYLQQDAGTLHNNKQSPHEDADSTL